VGIHEDTLQGLQEALDYVKGDKTKGRSFTVSISDDELETMNKFYKLSEPNKHIAKVLINELYQASGRVG